MLTVFVPPGESGYFEEGKIVNGDNVTIKYVPRPHNGRMVVDVPSPFFRSQILRGVQGLKWERENEEVMAWMGQNGWTVDINDAFPGAGRPPPVAPVAVEAVTVMVRMLAPEGVTSYSHDGAEHKIGKDGSVTVDDQLANVLRSHGFKDAA